MLAIGCRFTEVATNFRTLPVPKNLIHIDIDPAQIGLNYPARVAIAADARAASQALLEALPQRQSAWAETWARARAAVVNQPEWLITTLRRELPDDAVVVNDTCEIGRRMQADFPAYRPRTCLYPANYLSLGWGFPAAVGAAVALPERPVVAICGDGGFLMTGQELATAVRYQLRLITVIHNDATYGAIKTIQKNKHAARYLDTDLNNPDFQVLAQAYGVPAWRVCQEGEFAVALQKALLHNGPVMIEVTDSWRNLRV
jgi:acetolactate synthase-1/2/3 large subunit